MLTPRSPVGHFLPDRMTYVAKDSTLRSHQYDNHKFNIVILYWGGGLLYATSGDSKKFQIDEPKLLRSAQNY